MKKIYHTILQDIVSVMVFKNVICGVIKPSNKGTAVPNYTYNQAEWSINSAKDFMLARENSKIESKIEV
jgi:uncharacterized membrane protein